MPATGWMGSDEADTSSLARPVARPRGYRPNVLFAATVSVGSFLFASGVAAAWFSPPELYLTSFAGYDPPVDAVAGVLLLAVAVRIRERSRVAWIFSIVAPLFAIGIALLSLNILSGAAAVVAGLLLALLYPSRVRFYRGSITGTETAQYSVLLGALLSILYGMVGAKYLGDQFSPKPGIHGWGEALYFTISTISTNGSDYLPITDTARLYTVVLILLGVGAFLSAVVVYFVPFLQQRLERVSRRLEQAQMEQLVDHVIVCGTSPEVRAIAAALRDAQTASVIIGDQVDEVRRLEADGFRTLVGESSAEDVLRRAGVERARALIAAGSTDAENLLTVITVRGILPHLRIVALATAPASVSKLQRAGANEVVSVISVAAHLVTDAVLHAPSFEE
ncbi:MAG TPA: NAD-binding protein [Thermoplasmata archaeon]|nr:NAD-binding protein [Thermoplasmata archaeon]